MQALYRQRSPVTKGDPFTSRLGMCEKIPYLRLVPPLAGFRPTRMGGWEKLWGGTFIALGSKLEEGGKDLGVL